MKLSIVTVCYNAEACIDKTIKSILNQTLPIYEYIVIDGASNDATYSHVCSYDSDFKEKGIIFKHISEPDRGISDAFNKGIQMATGDIIGLINADDELTENANEILNEIIENNQADIYYGNCLWIDNDRNMEYIRKPSTKLNKLLYNMVLIHPSTFVKKEAYNKCGLFDITYKLCMDKELLYRMYKSEMKFVYIDEILSKMASGGVSDTNIKAVYKEGSRMALSYGEPFLKAKAIEIKKTIRNRIVTQLKHTLVFRKIKIVEMHKDGVIV